MPDANPTSPQPSSIAPSNPDAHRRFWLPDPRTYELRMEKDRHDEALYQFGEYVYFALMWKLQDEIDGLVERCSICFKGAGRMAQAYSHGEFTSTCTSCWGTTFEGGIRALLIRPAIFTYTEDTTEQKPRGETVSATADLQIVSDITLHSDDYMFRIDGTRWQMDRWNGDYLTVGFNPATAAINFTSHWVKEDTSSPIYNFGPSAADIRSTLELRNGSRFPVDFHEHEQINGPYL